MNFKELRVYQRNEQRSELGKLPDNFYVEVNNYCKSLEENKDYNTLGNVLSIVNIIKQKRIIKLMNHAFFYQHHANDLDDVSERIPNITSLETSLFIKFVKNLTEFEEYVTQECEYLKKDNKG